MNMQEKSELLRVTGSRYFNSEYRGQIFLLWFQAGKPDATSLARIIEPVSGTTVKPSSKDLKKWIDEEFRDKADSLDRQMTKALTEQVVVSRVEMLKRHADIGKSMQNMAMAYFDTHENDLNANAAIKMLVEGIRVERESSGIPEAIAKMTNMSDEQLLKELEDIITKDAPVKLDSGLDSYEQD
jgi:hypothetical protein